MSLFEYFVIFCIVIFVVVFIGKLITWETRPTTKSETNPTPKPQFTTELEALIAIEANTRQTLELLQQQNRRSLWSMLFLGSIASRD